MGLRLAKAHTNARGHIHGGLIASLADNSMGYSCARVATGWTTSYVTVSLAVDYVGSAQIGVACGRVRGDQDRQHDLFCAKPDQG